MIELRVEDYCYECPMFEAIVKKEYKNGYRAIVECEDRMKCMFIKKHIAPKMLGGKS